MSFLGNRMRSKKNKRNFGVRDVDVLKSMSKDQLAWIGAIALAYNDAEEWLRILRINIGADVGLANEFINFVGVGTLATSTWNAIRHSEVAADIKKMAELSLTGEGFPQLKSWRDGVVHARVFDAENQIGRVPNKGKSDQILLSELALEGLYRRLVAITNELKELSTIMSFSRSLALLRAEEVQYRSGYEIDIDTATKELARFQSARRNLAPLPT